MRKKPSKIIYSAPMVVVGSTDTAFLLDHLMKFVRDRHRQDTELLHRRYRQYLSITSLVQEGLANHPTEGRWQRYADNQVRERESITNAIVLHLNARCTPGIIFGQMPGTSIWGFYREPK